MEEANYTKLVNLAIGKTSSTAKKKINQLTKKDIGNKIAESYKKTNKTEPSIQQYQVLVQRLVQQNQFTLQNQFHNNNNRINPNNQLVSQNSGQQRPNYYYCYHNNKFKVATIPNTATLEYYQSIYIHYKQRFNISDGIEVVKKSVYQYIENCINNYLLETTIFQNETLATYFQELNFNIIEYCKEKYPVQTTPNTPILQKTTAKHLQTPEQETNIKLPLSITLFPILLIQLQTPSSLLNHFSRPEDFQSSKNLTQQQKPISTSTNIIEYLQENESNHSKNLESKKTESEQKETPENEEEIATAYIAKIPEFTGENNDTSPQEWLDKVQKAEDILDQFIAELKDKLIKKVHSLAPEDLATAIRHVKNYEMAMKEANHTKLVNLAIEKTSSAAKKK
ncbi:hypothetical protein G9A89_008284 [Geosiphon pyriformis]|nr:hypothetical protein G9A89_008284 [Geosiphon pyriformis]